MSHGRTPLFRAFRRALQIAGAAGRPGAPPVDALVEASRSARLSRRGFLAGTAGSAAALMAAGCVPATPVNALATPSPAAGPRIAIVGGGMAGLSAAWTLRRAGLRATVYEAANRTGGRILSATGVVGPGFVTELGAEFIDTPHVTMLRYAAELDLDLIDVSTDDEQVEVLAFGGERRSLEEVVEALRPVILRMAIDQERLPKGIAHDAAPPLAVTGDRMSIADYLAAMTDAAPWMRDLLRVVYVTEFGLDAEEQSALNLLETFSWSRGEIAWFGDSDERFKVAGGNQRIPDGLAARLDGQIRLGHALRALAPAGEGYRLSFETAGGMVDVAADLVVMTLPFTMLRTVDLSIPMSQGKRAAIDGLGYGANAKLFLGFDRRVWRADGKCGNFFAADPAQSGWDSTRLQDGEAGALTVYLGGRVGADLGRQPAETRAREMLPALDRVFPGVASAFNGRASMFDWPRQRFVGGSYACYRPGQWTSVRGLEGAPVGNVLFAGEHCSADFQGFMEGAAETGEAAARLILARLGVRRRAA